MTLKELSQYYYLRKEIPMLEERLARLKAKAHSPKTQQMTGMPFGTGVGDPTGAAVDEIVSLEEFLAQRVADAEEELYKLESFIASVDDSHMRLILSLRFVDQMTWWQIADYIGGNNTDVTVRVACYRFLKESGKKKKCNTCNT